MRILLVSTGSGSRGGGEIFLDYLGKGLAEAGHEILLWIPANPRMDELAQRCSVFARIIRSEYRNTYDYKTRSLATAFNWRISRRIAREWAALKPDVIHLNKQNLEDGLDLLQAVTLCDIPSICTIHLTQSGASLGLKMSGLRDSIARTSLSKYQGTFVAVQETRRAALADFLDGRARTATVHNGVPSIATDHFQNMRSAKRREMGFTPDHFVVVGLGRLVEQKRPFVFLETAKALSQQLPNARFVWVGDGVLAGQWDEWVEREKLGNVIIRAGWQAEPLPFLLAGDAMLHVAGYEGLPLAIIEAMAVGLPCAVSREFAMEIPLFNQETVLFLDTPAALAAKFNDATALRAVARSARGLVDTEFSQETMVKSYTQLYADAERAAT